MSVFREGREWTVACDGDCGHSIRTGQREFRQAVNYANRAEGWRARKLPDGWHNYCPDCAEQSNSDWDRVGIGFTRKVIEDN